MTSLKAVSFVARMLFILAMFLFSTVFTSVYAQTKNLKIGVITSVTGPMAPGFKSLVEAAKPAADLLNQKGGVTVKGEKYRIEVITADDQSSPPGAVGAANRLIQDGVKFIVAPLFIPSNRAIASVCEEEKVLRIVPICADPDPSGPPNKLSFNGEATFYNIPYVYDKLRKIYPQVKRIAIIAPDDPGAKLVTELTLKEIKKRGMEVVFHEAYRIPTEDFYPLLTKALAQKPDAIECIFGIIPWAKGIIEQSREMGFTGPIWSVAPVGDPNLLKSVLEPQYAYDVCVPNPDVSSPKMASIVKEFAKVMEKATRDMFVFDHVLVLQALWQITQGIEKAQSLDTDKVAKALESVVSIETPYGSGRFIGQEYVGMNRLFLRPIPFSRLLKGGKIEFDFLPVKYKRLALADSSFRRT